MTYVHTLHKRTVCYSYVRSEGHYVQLFYGLQLSESWGGRCSCASGDNSNRWTYVIFALNIHLSLKDDSPSSAARPQADFKTLNTDPGADQRPDALSIGI